MRIVVLQHPQEKKEERGSVDILVRHYPAAEVKIGLSWRNLGKVLGQEAPNPKRWVVLYLGSALSRFADNARPKPGLYFVSKKGEVRQAPEETIDGCILLDGTWSQAKTLWWRNAWLLKLHRAVLIPESRSAYGKVRKEPRKECVSTLEAAAMILDFFGEPENAEVLRRQFREFLERLKSV